MEGLLIGDDGGCWHLGRNLSYEGDSSTNDDDDFFGHGRHSNGAMWPLELLYSHLRRRRPHKRADGVGTSRAADAATRNDVVEVAYGTRLEWSPSPDFGLGSSG